LPLRHLRKGGPKILEGDRYTHKLGEKGPLCWENLVSNGSLFGKHRGGIFPEMGGHNPTVSYYEEYFRRRYPPSKKGAKLPGGSVENHSSRYP